MYKTCTICPQSLFLGSTQKCFGLRLQVSFVQSLQQNSSCIIHPFSSQSRLSLTALSIFSLKFSFVSLLSVNSYFPHTVVHLLSQTVLLCTGDQSFTDDQTTSIVSLGKYILSMSLLFFWGGGGGRGIPFIVNSLRVFAIHCS